MESESTQELVSAENKKAPPREKSLLFRWLTRFLWLIVLGLFMGALFVGWQMKQTLTKQQHHLSQLQTKTLQLQTDHQNLQQTLTHTTQHIEEKLFAEQNTVRINMVKQLLYLGYYNLVYLKNNPSAITALTLANQQLKEVSSYGSEVENLRQLLSEKITQLQTLPTVDLTAILAQLNTLQTQVMTLPLKAPHSTVKNPTRNAPAEKTVAPSTPTSWRDHLRESLQHFKQLIVIRHLDQPIEPLLPEDQVLLLQHRLQLGLQQTQWALLHRDASVYQASLTSLKDWIQRYFEVQAPVTQNTLAIIDDLKKVALSTTIPDFKSVLSAMDTLENHLQTESIAMQPEPLR